MIMCTQNDTSKYTGLADILCKQFVLLLLHETLMLIKLTIYMNKIKTQ